MAKRRTKTGQTADTASGLARAVGVSRALVQKWVASPHWPFGASPPWDIRRVREWRAARKAARAAESDGSLLAARRRREWARARLAELELETKRAGLVDASEARRAMAHQVACLASWLNSLPSRIASELFSGRDAAAVDAAEDRIAAALDEQRHALGDGVPIRITRAALDAVILDVFAVTPDAKKG